jgi:hypothetical protein
VEAAGDDGRFARVQAQVAEARRTIDELKRRCGIKKKGYAISLSDLTEG